MPFFTKENMLSLLYPRRCPFCDRALPPGGYIHRACLDSIAAIPSPRCRKCGRGIEAGTLCSDCARTEHVFKEAYGILPYDGEVREMVRRFKYAGRAEYADVLGMLLSRGAGGRIRRWGITALVPVPASPERIRLRGYNQADLLAAALGKDTGLPVRRDLVLHAPDGAEQAAKLGKEARRARTRRLFSPGSGRADGERLLLVDDVYTTGGTADAAAKILYGRGAAAVYVLTLCISGSGQRSGSRFFVKKASDGLR